MQAASLLIFQSISLRSLLLPLSTQGLLSRRSRRDLRLEGERGQSRRPSHTSETVPAGASGPPGLDGAARYQRMVQAAEDAEQTQHQKPTCFLSHLARASWKSFPPHPEVSAASDSGPQCHGECGRVVASRHR